MGATEIVGYQSAPVLRLCTAGAVIIAEALIRRRWAEISADKILCLCVKFPVL